MEDKNQYNDEYQFADLDAINPDGTGEEPPAGADEFSEQSSTKKSFFDFGKENLKRNILIAVALLVVVFMLYKFIGSFFASKDEIDKASISAVKPLVQTPATPPPIQPTTAPVQPVSPGMSQKLSDLEASQKNTLSEVSTMSTQLGTISTNMNEINAKMAELNQVIATLSAKLDEQSREMEQLIIRREAKKKAQHHHVTRRGPSPTKYYLQAVIPGRAWLIAKNGATLTVREGTVISGYGVVKLIDPSQGRVITSSGQVIRFSQEDS